ncbi:MAG: hypothetical protein R3F53_03590 [Gammaproteobacteria bacterium]
MCKLSRAMSSRSSQPSLLHFHAVEWAQVDNADILLVDADDADALRAWSSIKADRPALPAILVNDEAVETYDFTEISLARDCLARVLLQVLGDVARYQMNRMDKRQSADQSGCQAF